jgi:hypothetical protein
MKFRWPVLLCLVALLAASLYIGTQANVLPGFRPSYEGDDAVLVPSYFEVDSIGAHLQNSWTLSVRRDGSARLGYGSNDVVANLPAGSVSFWNLYAKVWPTLRSKAHPSDNVAIFMGSKGQGSMPQAYSNQKLAIDEVLRLLEEKGVRAGDKRSAELLAKYPLH